MRVKLRDIAERANVSMATVSRVLNNNPGVDERTRASVLQVLGQLGYPMIENKPLSAASSGKSILVTTRGVISKVLDRPVLDLQGMEGNGVISGLNTFIVDGIEVVAHNLGVEMSIRRVRLEDPTEEDMSHLTRADGVVLVGGIIAPEVIDALEDAHVPFVLAAAHLGEKEINCVFADYQNGAAQAVLELARLGHRRIALVNGPATTTTSQDKLAGYLLALYKAGIRLDQQLIVAAHEFHPSNGYQATQALLAQTRDFSAILYAGDTLAIGGLRALQEAGIEVPNQVSIVGFYDEPIAQFTNPQLSTVHLSWQRMGQIAAQRLIALLDHEDEERLRISIPMSLILRESTAHRRPG